MVSLGTCHLGAYLSKDSKNYSVTCSKFLNDQPSVASMQPPSMGAQNPGQCLASVWQISLAKHCGLIALLYAVEAFKT